VRQHTLPTPGQPQKQTRHLVIGYALPLACWAALWSSEYRAVVAASRCSMRSVRHQIMDLVRVYIYAP